MIAARAPERKLCKLLSPQHPQQRCRMWEGEPQSIEYVYASVSVDNHRLIGGIESLVEDHRAPFGSRRCVQRPGECASSRKPITTCLSPKKAGSPAPAAGLLPAGASGWAAAAAGSYSGRAPGNLRCCTHAHVCHDCGSVPVSNPSVLCSSGALLRGLHNEATAVLLPHPR